MYINALELQNYEKDIYFGVRLLEEMNDRQPHKKGDLAKALTLDTRSVQRLLEELGRSYLRFTEADLPLFEKNGNSYQLLIANQTMEQNQFLVDLIRHSLAYRLLDLLIAGNVRTIKELSEKLFRSESTIRRKLKEIRKELTPLQLTIERGEVCFQAPEAVIRMYLSVYYWRLFRGKDWPFAPLQHELVEKVSQAIQRFFQVDLNPIKEQRLEYLVAAHLLREVQHYSLEQAASQTVLKNDPLFNDFSRQLKAAMPPYFQKQEPLGNLFLNLLTREEYYHEPTITKKIHRLLAKAPFSVIDEVDAMYQVLEKKINDRSTWKKFQALQAENYLISGHLYHRLFPMIHFNINGKAFWTMVTQQQPKLVAFVAEILSDQGGSESILFGRYLSVLRRLPELTVQPVLRIFLQTDLPEFEELILKEDVRRFLANDFQVVFAETLENSDLCLTTSLLYDNDEVPTLAITQELRMADYFALLRLVQGFGGKSF
ncbi:helix-turn-helix domain-containing protein [Enterococcus dongliensis]|uniref:helix-turn-helix domain-containing protein n=1 Tax=Enterococcus dongliensis TaxID=2559925 RepID=UPI002892477C|nr:helix-turn-helix domain-containing protein [Enterococcus dongliensis]MDT2673844.1 helix-turn-helix domain-containing protein [Enterococcus dongliensis]